MKCKKIAAMIVASATFMVFATSGFAAASVNTTTTYNQISDKVEVNVAVTGADAGKEVTYLVKSKDAGNKIVYIDQKTATDGTVNFNYKVAKADITKLGATVQFGTDGTTVITGDGDIEFTKPGVTCSNADITFYSDKSCENAIADTLVVGKGEKVYAQVKPHKDYEVKSVKVNGSEVVADGGVYTITNATTIVVETSSTYVAPGVETPEITYDKETQDGGSITIDGEKFDNVVTKTTILKVVGAPKEVGVTYNGTKYPALKLDGSNFTDADGLCAVKIVAPAGTEIVVTPYFE